MLFRSNEAEPRLGSAGVAMKWFVVFAVFFWLLCGLIGAWMLEGRDDLHLKTIARGPITLIEAFKEDPLTYPG
jgi:hypothetical protein